MNYCQIVYVEQNWKCRSIGFLYFERKMHGKSLFGVMLLECGIYVIPFVVFHFHVSVSVSSWIFPFIWPQIECLYTKNEMEQNFHCHFRYVCSFKYVLKAMCFIVHIQKSLSMLAIKQHLSKQQITTLIFHVISRAKTNKNLNRFRSILNACE